MRQDGGGPTSQNGRPIPAALEAFAVIKDICVHLDGRSDAPRLAVAGRIAGLFGSHVTGLFLNILPEPRVSLIQDPDITALLVAETAAVRAEGDATERVLAARIRDLTPQGEVQRHDIPVSRVGVVAGSAARTSDLLIASRPYDADGTSRWPGLVEAGLFASGRGVLLVPDRAAVADGPIGTVLVAWRDTREAARAVAEAMPLLRAARNVIVAMAEGETASEAAGYEPGADIARHLSRHGVAVELRHLAGWTEPSDALLHEIALTGAEFAVLGAYGHSRFREWITGGVTHDFLARCPVPMLMAH